PDLVDVFVPGAALATRAGAFVAGKAMSRAEARGIDWLERLEKLTQRRQEKGLAGSTAINQSNIFEQYVNVLVALAAQQPLLLIIDDLQWADAASIGLLFHLGRRIEQSRILLLGAYRPDEIALGRRGERHPLEKVLAEFKRYFGDIWVGLGQAGETEGRELVDALLDAEPNRLGEAFRQALFRHTGGHPLFIIELLRDMQERGDLLHDDEGLWVEGPALDWRRLPARIEGVIEERVGRLEEELRETLSVAAVEGEDFTAQVVARVQETQELRLLRELSRELEKRHHLVREREEVRVGRQRLTHYQFAHVLFQQYLYNELSAGERRLLHGAVAEVLEELYEGRTEEITVQLARHYAEAGEEDKAMGYLVQAGDRARRLYANQEALSYYQQALALAEGTDGYHDILARRAKVLLDMFHGQEAANDYERLLTSTRQSGDRKGELESLLGLASATYAIALGEPGLAPESLRFYEQAYALARELGDKVCMVRALVPTVWFTDYWPEYWDQAVANVEDAWALSQEVGDEELIIESMMARAHRDLASIEEVEELLTQLESRHDLSRLKDAYFRLTWRHLFAGNFARCVECCDASIDLAAKLGAPPVMYSTIKALALLGLGRYDAAWESLQQEIADEEYPLGRALKHFGTGMYYLELLAYGEAATVFEDTVEQAKRVGRSWLTPWAHAELSRCLLRSGRLDEVNLDWTTQGLASTDTTLPADVPHVLGEIALFKGKLDEALRQAEKACAEAEAHGWRPAHVSALELRLRVLLQLNRPGEVIPLADKGIRIAEEMAYRPLIWRVRAAK
ncbi:MAG: AAA family ATPase, partial [Anaerolineae bacterium]